MDVLTLSKTISHALRHEPWLYELELDSDGWVSVHALLSALRNHREEWSSLNEEDLHSLIRKSSKKRFEILEHQIRAFYGHSVPKLLEKERSEPPEILYHGTAHEVVPSIKAEGLKPMNRQYVHLSADIETAKEVGRRKSRNPVILTVHAKQGYEDGIGFYLGNEKVWLADVVPSSLIEIISSS